MNTVLYTIYFFFIRKSETDTAQANITLTIHGQFTPRMADVFNQTFSVNYEQRNFEIQRTDIQMGGIVKMFQSIFKTFEICLLDQCTTIKCYLLCY